MSPEEILLMLVTDGRVRIPIVELTSFPGIASGLSLLMEQELIVAWQDEDESGNEVPTISLTHVTVAKYELSANHDGSLWLAPGRQPSRPYLDLTTVAGRHCYLESDLNGYASEMGGGLDGLAAAIGNDPADIIDAQEQAEQEFHAREAERLANEIQGLGRRHRCSLPPVREPYPAPIILLTGCRPWPPTDRLMDKSGICPVCKDNPRAVDRKPMSEDTACLWCDRMGIDAKLRNASEPRAAKRA